MHENAGLSPTQPKIPMWPGQHSAESDYESGQVANLVRRYRELRSAVEIISTHFDKVGQSSTKTDKEDLLCALADIDRAMSGLSPSQRMVIRMMRLGYEYEDICSIKGLSMPAVKFHAREGIIRLTSYLNCTGPYRQDGG